MPINVDAVAIKACKGVVTDGLNTVTVNADAVNVYQESCWTAGYVLIDSTTAEGDTHLLTYVSPGIWNFTVPDNATNFALCMVGGGGAGENNSSSDSNGGSSGAIVSSPISYGAGAVLYCVIGAGGATPSAAGSATTFDIISAPGGVGGTYVGLGGARNTCGGDSFDGAGSSSSDTLGGQGSGFGNGGAGAGHTGTGAGGPGYRGSGGGSGGHTTGNPIGPGGAGVIKVSWS